MGIGRKIFHLSVIHHVTYDFLRDYPLLMDHSAKFMRNVFSDGVENIFNFCRWFWRLLGPYRYDFLRGWYNNPRFLFWGLYEFGAGVSQGVFFLHLVYDASRRECLGFELLKLGYLLSSLI